MPIKDRRNLALVEVLERLLDSGVVVSGEVIISLAGVDLIAVHLDLLACSVRSLKESQGV